MQLDQSSIGFLVSSLSISLYVFCKSGHELIRTIRAIWSLALGLITEINFDFDIIGLLLRAVYHHQTTWALNSRILRVLVFVSFQIFSTMI